MGINCFFRFILQASVSIITIVLFNIGSIEISSKDLFAWFQMLVFAIGSYLAYLLVEFNSLTWDILTNKVTFEAFPTELKKYLLKTPEPIEGINGYDNHSDENRNNIKQFWRNSCEQFSINKKIVMQIFVIETREIVGNQHTKDEIKQYKETHSSNEPNEQQLINKKKMMANEDNYVLKPFLIESNKCWSIFFNSGIFIVMTLLGLSEYYYFIFLCMTQYQTVQLTKIVSSQDDLYTEESIREYPLASMLYDDKEMSLDNKDIGNETQV